MKILFVCAENAYRSPIAEALLKKVKPEIKVDSAGINPSSLISEAAKKYLTRENVQHLLKKAPEGLSEKDPNKESMVKTTSSLKIPKKRKT